MDKPMFPGVRIRYTMDGLGAVDSDHAIEAGDEGTYVGPAPDKGWHITTIDVNGETLIVPVANSMFEVVESSRT